MNNVLVVEDDHDTYMLIKQSLESAGYVVTKVSVRDAAIDIVQTMKFDLYIVDLGLVGGDAMSLLEAIVEADPDNHSKIVIHTGKNLSKEQTDSLLNYSRSIVQKSLESPASLADLASNIIDLDRPASSAKHH